MGEEAELQEFIQAHVSEGDFSGGVDGERIQAVEDGLGIELPETYKGFLREYGHGGLFGCEILGIGKSENPPVLRFNLAMREHGLPPAYVAIENVDEFLHCLDTTAIKDGDSPVIRWYQGSDRGKIIADRFITFLLEQFRDAQENWE